MSENCGLADRTLPLATRSFAGNELTVGLFLVVQLKKEQELLAGGKPKAEEKDSSKGFSRRRIAESKQAEVGDRIGISRR